MFEWSDFTTAFWAFFLILPIVSFIHQLGHWTMAKMLGGTSDFVIGKGWIICYFVDHCHIRYLFSFQLLTYKCRIAVLVFLGNNPFINGKECVDREDIILPPQQEKLLQEIRDVNDKTVLVLVSSYPYAINWAEKHVEGILYTSHAGPELGHAVAEVLFGDVNPAGRLSMTWYQSVKQLPSILDYE